MTAPASDAPKSNFEKLVAATPVVLTVIATAFAGLSTSEMTQAMFHRTLAGQNQAKAADQWGFFQAKRIRGTQMELAVDMLQGQSGYRRFDLEKIRELVKRFSENGRFRGDARDPEALRTSLALMADRPETARTVHLLNDESHPRIDRRLVDDERVRRTVEAQAERDPSVPGLVAAIPLADLETAIRQVESKAKTFEEANGETEEAVRQLDRAVKQVVTLSEMGSARGHVPESSLSELRREMADLLTGFRTLRHEYTSRRYREEALANRELAGLYELRVLKNGADSERHRTRSKFFFYVMLGAQLGVTVSSLAMARQHKSLLWSLAGVAGLLSLLVGAYVYLAM